MQAMQKMSPALMRTDIKETDEAYQPTIDLPGFKKEDILGRAQDSYLSITAQTQSESEDKDEKGTYVREPSAENAAAPSTWRRYRRRRHQG